MTKISKSELTVYSGLAVATITGFEPEKIEDEDGNLYASQEVDPIGTANWLVANGYGMAPEDGDSQDRGILWTDYDGPAWTFDVLIASDEVEDLKKACQESGYSFDSARDVTEPEVFGDGGGTVEILKHRDGWVLAQ